MPQIDELRAYLLAKPGATEEYPFGPDTLVVKVAGKVFALIGLNDKPLSVSLKADPFNAQYLRDTFPAVQPGYHLNKRHWNSVTLDGSVPANEVRGMIDESYMLVVAGLTRAARQKLQ